MTTIKQWQSRLEEAAHFSQEDYENDKCHFMQAEIDELRAENAKLRAALTEYIAAADNCMLPEGADDIFRFAEADKAARAALGEV